MLDGLLRNVRLVDGTGAPARWADVGWSGDRIAHVRPQGCIGDVARQVVDAQGLVLAPGFIDVHTHDDALMLQATPRGAQHPKLSQGITTIVTGNCGISLAPLVSQEVLAPLDILGRSEYRFASFGAYLDALEAARPVCNVASLVGHTTLRVRHLRDLSREATEAQTRAMAADVAEALASGALGLSTGVYYPPARAATTQELIAVARPLAGARAPVAMHLRDEAAGIDDALREAFSVASAIGCPLVLSHHKLVGRPNHGRSMQTLAQIEAARSLVDVCLDCYPYDASSTMLLPERVASSRDVRLTWSEGRPDLTGQSLIQAAVREGKTPLDLASECMPAGAVYFAMDEVDVRRILAHPLTMIGSDGLAHDRSPHPRLWGSFPRVLGRYVREQSLLTLEAAIHKMTGLSARRFGLDQETANRRARGRIEPGMAADFVLLDPERIADRATFEAPQTPSIGVERVYVNGRLALRHGQVCDAHAGRVLRRA